MSNRSIHHFQGVKGASHTIYTPNQAKAIKLVKSKKTKHSIELSDKEIIQMRRIAGIRKASTEHTLRAFITKILSL